MMDGPVTDLAKSSSVLPEASKPNVLPVPVVEPRSAGVSDFTLGLIWFLIGSVAGAGALYIWLSGFLNSVA